MVEGTYHQTRFLLDAAARTTEGGLIMITVTIDFIALFIGFCIGLVVGVVVVSYAEMHEGGPWSSGWTAGYTSGTQLRKYIEKTSRSDNNAKQ